MLLFNILTVSMTPSAGRLFLNFSSTCYTRPIVDEASGAVTPTEFTIDAPLLSLVPLPAFTMDSADVTGFRDIRLFYYCVLDTIGSIVSANNDVSFAMPSAAGCW